MAANGQNINLDIFTGGLDTYNPEYNNPLNTSPDLDNIVILDRGFKKRNGDSVFNSSAMVSSSTAVTGLGYMQFDSGTEFLNAVAGTKFFTSSSLTGTMADATGALTITAAVGNLWTPVSFNNLQIWFGGAPNAPFKYSGTGNAAALGGSPPSAYTAFVSNNRVFAVSTAANPSRIYWPIVSNPEDWTGAGSGTSDVAMSDGEALQCGVPLGTDTVILFKNSSTHLMVTTRQPFPIYQLQRGIGICGRNAYALAEGEIYFITPELRMMSTRNGVAFKSYSNGVNDILDSINPNRIAYIQGFHYHQLDWIIWLFSTGSSTTNNYCLVWDMKHNCWLRNTTGWKANVIAAVQGRRPFCGHYDGKIYEKLKSTVFADASETSPGAIDAYWRSPFRNLGDGLDQVVQPHYVNVACLSESASTIDTSYGFDFTSPATTQQFSLLPAGSLWDVGLWDVATWGGQNAIVLRQFVYGRGNLFSFKIRNATATQGFTVQGASIRLRDSKARKVFTGV